MFNKIIAFMKKTLIYIYRIYSCLRGKIVFMKIIYKGDKNDYYFLKFGHLGDVVRTLPTISLFKHYVQLQNDTVDKIIVIISSNQSGLVKINPEIDEKIILSKKQIMYLRRFAESKWNHYYLYSDSYGPFHVSEVYKIPYEYVKKNLEYFRISEAVNTLFADDALEYVKEKEINPEKTLILAPYAGSSSSLPYDILNPIIISYKKMGFRVFTNAGLSEKPLNGTELLSEPANIVFGIISMGATVIGVQSGFMDSCEWLNLTHKRIKVFFIDTEQDKEYLHNYSYSLERHIERRGSAVTIVVSNEEQKRLLCGEIESLGLYYLKGAIQRESAISYLTDKNSSFCYESNINEYIPKIVKCKNYLIIISSTGGNLLSENFVSKDSLSLEEFDNNQNFLAVYDTDTGLVEVAASDDLAHGQSYLGTIVDCYRLMHDSKNNFQYPLDNWLYVYSNAKDKLGYSKASIVINGEEYSPNQEGLNIVIYSKELGCVVDIFSVNFDKDFTNNIFRDNEEALHEY